MSTENVPLTKEELFNELYLATLHRPFKDQYDDKWQEEPFWAAVEVFKAQVKEIGYDDPLDRLKSYRGRETFEKIRDNFKAGPPACLREGWMSPYTGEKIDVLSALEAIHHVQGNKYEGKERIVILDFWATWCCPCIELGLELSDLSEKHAGQVAVIGINNEVIFRKTEYVAIPCIVLVVDNEVRFAGSGSRFEEHLDVALKEVYPKEE